MSSKVKREQDIEIKMEYPHNKEDSCLDESDLSEDDNQDEYCMSHVEMCQVWIKEEPGLDPLPEEYTPDDAVKTCEIWIKEESNEEETYSDGVIDLFGEEKNPFGGDGFGEDLFNHPSTSSRYQDSFVCFHCGRILKSKKHMKFHILLFHGMHFGLESRVIRRYKKKWLHREKIYDFIPIYPKVELKVKRSKERCYQCPYCEYKSTRSSNLKSHIVAKHTDVKPYQCPHCSFTSAYTNHLKRHVTAKHVDEKAHKCPYCDYKSSNYGPLKIHVLAKHSETTFNCPQCEFVSVYQNHLKRHLKAKHTNERPYECQVCPYMTSLKSSLEKHIMAKHTKKKPYDCPHCDYKATQSHHVTNHVNAKHTNLKPYQCSECSYEASRLDHLKGHMKAKHKVFEM